MSYTLIFENELFMRNHSSPFISSDILKIFPRNSETSIWFSPWELIEQIKNNPLNITEAHYTMLLTLEDILSLTPDTKINLNNYKTSLTEFNNVYPNMLIREVNYNKSNLFLWSLILYILTLISLFILSIFRFSHNKYKLIPLILIVIGFRPSLQRLTVNTCPHEVINAPKRLSEIPIIK